MTNRNAMPFVKIAALAIVATALAVATVAACTPAPTVAPTSTPAPTWTPSPMPTWTPVVVRIVTPTVAPTSTATATVTPTNTATPAPAPTVVPTVTPTSTPTPSASPTSTPTPVPTVTPSPTTLPTSTPTAIPTVLPTATNTPMPTIAPEPTPGSTPTPLPDDAHPDLAPLIALYNATNGSEWSNNENWLSDRPLYQWFGLKVNIDGRLTEINLGSNALDGTLPPELGDLDQLQLIDLNGNPMLSGVIPREFGRLTQLQTLTLSRNDLTGPIPHEIGLLPNLHHLDLSHNSLSGEIPPSLLRSETIFAINLGNNDLTGTIPSEFAVDSRIGWLHLESNRLTGEIPTEIGRLPRLSELRLDDNQLSGPIPDSIVQIERLRIFSANNNQLTGSIPEGLSTLRYLDQLHLNYNRLTGTVPEELGDFEQLTRLGIIGNNFSGCIPTSVRDNVASNVAFANIPVCGEQVLAVPVAPAYIEIANRDELTPSHIQAIELGAQWLDEFITEVGWPIPEDKITIYVADREGLAGILADFDDQCDLACATRVFSWAGTAARPGTAFVLLIDLHVRTAPAVQARVAARLIFHIMRLEVLDNLPPERRATDPAWWSGGIATLFSELALADGMDTPRDDNRRRVTEWSSSFTEPLWELEEDPGTAIDSRGAAAVDLLASQVGLRALSDFYTERIDGETWKQTFERVFNISVPDFYELFNQHHNDGYPLGQLPMEGSTQWP